MIKYFFFDKKCVIDKELADRSNVKLNLQNLLIKFDEISFVNQVHGSEVLLIDSKEKIPPNQGLPKADAIVTNLKNIAISVITADCAPILLYDEEKEIIAAIHAGWRGAKAGVIAAAVRKMQFLGADIDKIVANIGPMIHQKSYQISQEFRDEFLLDSQEFARFFIKDKSLQDHYLFDLVAFVKHKLQELEIAKIHDVNIDSYVDDNYASYRRSCHLGIKNSGRNVSLIIASD